MEIHSFLAPLPRFPVHILESVTKPEFKLCFGAWNLNEEFRSLFLQITDFPRRLLMHRYVEFSQNVNWKMMVIISPEMRNPGCKIFIEFGFQMVIIAQNDHAASQKIAKVFQLNGDGKIMAITFDFRELGMI